jgi:pimeloyl-ACP methyl ester carboxylesterase
VSDAQADIDLDDRAPRHDVPDGGRSGFTILDGRQVHYLEWGHRSLPPVLALHGGGQTAYMFEELGAALARRYHVLAPDLPGHGDSDSIAPVDQVAGGVGREALAVTVPPLLEHFGIERCPIVGASLGGITALTLAARQPELVSGIVLIDVGHRLELDGVRKITDFLRAHESFASLDEAATEIARYLPHRKNVRPASLTRNLRLRGDGRWVWKHTLGRRLREAVEQGDEGPPPGALLEGVDRDAASLTCPVLVLRGSASDVLSDQGAQEVVDLIPRARLAVVEDAGHLAVGDNPQSSVSQIAAFLDSL